MGITLCMGCLFSFIFCIVSVMWVLFYNVNTEQGYSIEMFGDLYRHVVDFDGVKLIGIDN